MGGFFIMATEKSKTQSKPKLSVTAKVDRMVDREDAKVKAYASINIGGEFIIRDIAVVEGQKGIFAKMPFRSYKSSDGETKYSDIAFAITDSARHSIEDAVIGAYREALGESEDELPDKDESPTQSM